MGRGHWSMAGSSSYDGARSREPRAALPRGEEKERAEVTAANSQGYRRTVGWLGTSVCVDRSVWCVRRHLLPWADDAAIDRVGQSIERASKQSVTGAEDVEPRRVCSGWELLWGLVDVAVVEARFVKQAAAAALQQDVERFVRRGKAEARRKRRSRRAGCKAGEKETDAGGAAGGGEKRRGRVGVADGWARRRVQYKTRSER
ncbi:hypothetical protein BGZ61DRAFT_561028 [Ilyonectria robusta]|uniref:uncharacterized protein n=1 Tax=Ilyonectria robusta TaxID=1079257 RepID=UPI001E8DCAEE|nr:uncharacterized protein BGZ61DRAFT_561028 [Ilyonectria robusta]KAH8735287.1 hypothetical protein BGZ61DRAFT_561028 [Ilyonectria robusta]